MENELACLFCDVAINTRHERLLILACAIPALIVWIRVLMLKGHATWSTGPLVWVAHVLIYTFVALLALIPHPFRVLWSQGIRVHGVLMMLFLGVEVVRHELNKRSGTAHA